ncbi:MAG TPA: 23S rRNA (guanosine(2251)-2'-O)-methyltransferase RlmB [Gammaproteobacteria bacterium]|nr:23S rRNA (guanosine(2251)-2'-O)-methyltransferase RlmB [Gammaproteobacteria bacterium]
MKTDNLIYGLHAVNAALDAGTITELWALQNRQDKRLQAVRDNARNKQITVHNADRDLLDRMTANARHQGIVARLNDTGVQLPQDLDSLLDSLTEPAFLLVLDGVQDPHNLGACLRVANAAGVHAIIAPKDRAAGLTPAARKVASGAAERTPFIQVTNLARALRQLRDTGIWLVGAAGEAEQTLYSARLTGPLALVMGAEGTGLRRLTREHCDELIKLPMHGTVSSLNVSVASGICLYEAVRQRSTQK